MKITVDKQVFERPDPCTPRVVLALVGKSPEEYALYADCYPAQDQVQMVQLDEPCEWASTFRTAPKYVNGG